MLTAGFKNVPSAERSVSFRKVITPNKRARRCSLMQSSCHFIKKRQPSVQADVSPPITLPSMPEISGGFTAKTWLRCPRTMHSSLSAFSNHCGTSNRSLPHPPSHHVSLSQPCLPVANIGPTKILPYLFLGSQGDAHCEETMTQNGIAYVLNVSISGPRPTFIQDGHFHRIPINDSYSDKLSPFFNDAFQFLDKVREANGCVLVHCLAGVSRSPTLAIAYIMHSLGMSMDEAYRYVKDKRPTISPNFNFLGQLLEYEKQLHLKVPVETRIIHGESVSKKECTVNICDLVKDESSQRATLGFTNVATSHSLALTSPTTALAKLNFNQLSPLREQSSPCSTDLPSDVPLISHTPMTVITSGLTLRIGPKHCATKRPRSDPSSTDDHGIDEAGQCGTSMKRPLMRPNSICFALGAKPGVPRKMLSGALMPDGSQSIILPSLVVGEESSMCLDEPSPPVEAKSNEDEIQCRVVKSQVHRENLSPMKEEQISKPLRHGKGKTLTNHPVNIIQSRETLTSRPNKLFLPDRNSRSQIQPCRTSTPESNKLFGAPTAIEPNQPHGTLMSQPADMLIIHNGETDYSEHPQVAMARKSRSLEDILNYPVPSEARNSSEHGFLFDCRRHPSYLISVLASPVALGLDKHLRRCQTTNPDSFQSPSSTDSLEMIPVS